MDQKSSPTYVYKIVPSAPPEPLPAEYPVSDMDQDDGFIHLSTVLQVPVVAGRFFSASSSLWLIKLELGKLADPVKWEDGFPHLYGNFGAKDVNSVRKMERTEKQSWQESMHAVSWLE